MLPKEEEFYELVCKDRFDKIDKAIRSIDAKLFGNSGDGLTGRVVKVETVVRTQEGRWKWLIGTTTALCIGVFIKIIYDVVILLKSLNVEG